MVAAYSRRSAAGRPSGMSRSSFQAAISVSIVLMMRDGARMNSSAGSAAFSRSGVGAPANRAVSTWVVPSRPKALIRAVDQVGRGNGAQFARLDAQAIRAK